LIIRINSHLTVTFVIIIIMVIPCIIVSFTLSYTPIATIDLSSTCVNVIIAKQKKKKKGRANIGRHRQGKKQK